MWYKFSIKNDQPSSSFDAWHEGNLIKDPYTGKPKVLYHGTIKPPFDKFDLNQADPNAFIGKGIYTTEDPDDSGKNYSFESGPDVSLKIQLKKDELYEKYLDNLEEQERLGLDYNNKNDLDEKLKAMAIQELNFQAPRTIPLYGKMKNPLTISPVEPKIYSIYKEEEDFEPGYGEKILQELKLILGYYYYDERKIENVINLIREDLGEEFNFYELYMAIANRTNYRNYEIDWNDIITELIQSMGHDGVIIDAHSIFPDLVEYPTNHYVFFDPGQVKSPFNKTFDPNDKRINAQKNSWYKLSQESEEAEFSKFLSNKYNADIRLYITSNGDLKLDNIRLPKNMRGKGIGSKIMKEIIDYADFKGLRLILTTGVKDPYVGTTSSGRLKKFYKNFGFVENKGKDYSISDNMLRNPKPKLANKIPKYLKPGEVEIPEGMSRRFHYTSDDDLLDKIEKEGLKVNESKSWKYGDPKAIWSNPQIVNDQKPTIEFWEDPKHIIGDQYQFKDVLPNQIIGKHYSWYPKLHYILDLIHNDKMPVNEVMDRLEKIKDIEPYNKILEELKKYVV